MLATPTDRHLQPSGASPYDPVPPPTLSIYIIYFCPFHTHTQQFSFTFLLTLTSSHKVEDRHRGRKRLTTGQPFSLNGSHHSSFSLHVSRSAGPLLWNQMLSPSFLAYPPFLYGNRFPVVQVSYQDGRSRSLQAPREYAGIGRFPGLSARPARRQMCRMCAAPPSSP